MSRRRTASYTQLPLLPKAKKGKQSPYDLSEDELRQIYTLVPDEGPLNKNKKWFKVFCNDCQQFYGSIKDDRLQDYDMLQEHVVDIHKGFLIGKNERDQTKMVEDKYDEDSVKAIFSELPGYDDASMVPRSSSDFSEHQLRQLFDLDPAPGPDDMLEDKEPIKWFEVVCKVCGYVVGGIQEGSSLQDCRATHVHASCHRDFLLKLPTGINECHEDTMSMAPRPSYHSEAELLRIYLVDSYTTGHRRSAAPPSEKPVVVWYAVICKVCKKDVYTTKDYPSLQDNPWLQKHALMHSEYLSMDGPTVPDIDLEAYENKLLKGYDGGFNLDKDDASLQEGFVKICCRCLSENCSRGPHRYVMMDCVDCNESGTHLSWNCPSGNWESGQPTPCNRSD